MFTDYLSVTLTLTINGTATTIPGGTVSNMKVSLQPWGFSAEVSFWTSVVVGDTIFDSFCAPGLIAVDLAFTPAVEIPDTAPDPITVQGPVTRKSVSEFTSQDIDGNPIVGRKYTVEFADVAQVLWSQHYPCDLLASVAMSDLITPHMIGGITLDTSNFVAIGNQYPMLCLGLVREKGVSFYDFMMWYANDKNGVFSYDSSVNKYALADDKPDDSSPVVLNYADVEKVEIVFPEVTRHNLRILDGVADTGSTTVVNQAPDNSVASVRNDLLILSEVPADVAALTALELPKLRARMPLVDLEFKNFPRITFRPWKALACADNWGTEVFHSGTAYRVLSVEIQADSGITAPVDVPKPYLGYKIMMSARLEDATEPFVTRPAFRAPIYPIQVQAKIQGGGEATDRNYMIFQDKSTGAWSYQVNVPLFNQKINVPFVPAFVPGHFFFPYENNLTVLIEIFLDHAEIIRTLDWHDTVQLSSDAQGNQLLLGVNAKGQTSIQHSYTDESPVLTITHVAGPDTQTIQVSDGQIQMSVVEATAASTTVETYDVTPQVDAATAQLTTQVGGGIGDATASFGTAASGVKSKITDSTTKVNSQLKSSGDQVRSGVGDAKGQLQAQGAAFADMGAGVLAAAGDAKAELQGLNS